MTIDNRLRAIAFLLTCETLIDVGSDHAYLPIWLYLNKKIKKAYALDISEHCIKKIHENLKKYNISTDNITPVLSDGLLCFNGWENIGTAMIIGASGSSRPTKALFSKEGARRAGDLLESDSSVNIVIAGMGGENIAEIMEKAQNFKSADFILQPNSKVEILREFLYENRYDIVTEIIVEDENRLYNIMQARYTGVLYNPEPLEIIAGKNITHEGYIKKIIKRLRDILADLEIAGDEKYNIRTEFGFYRDIEGYITELERRI